MMETSLHVQAKTAAPPSLTPVRGSLLQRKCACGGSAGLSGECEGCSKQSLSLQRSTRNAEHETRNSGGMPSIVHDVLRSPGQPLDSQTRAFMEPRFGHDFSHVRVYTDARAAESAAAVNALAYTVGHAVVFGGGQYAPQSMNGQRLLAHELTHVVQQGATPLAGPMIQRQEEMAGPPPTQPQQGSECQRACREAYQRCVSALGPGTSVVGCSAGRDTCLRGCGSPARILGAGGEPSIQPKSVINQPGDMFEQEADRMADHVMRVSELPSSVSGADAFTSQWPGAPPLSRKALPSQETSSANAHQTYRWTEIPQAKLQSQGPRSLQRSLGTSAGNDDQNGGSAHNAAASLWLSPSVKLLTLKSPPHIQRQTPPATTSTPTPSSTGSRFSVNQTAYQQLVGQAIQRMSGRLTSAQTLAGSVQPILQAMLAQVIWRDASGVDVGGGSITFQLPGPPPVILNLRMVLDDNASPTQSGRFSPAQGALYVYVRDNNSVEALEETLYHEALHLVRSVIERHGPAALGASTQRGVQAAVRGLMPGEARATRDVVLLNLRALAQNANARRQTASQAQITNVQLDAMASWLVEEVQIRAETSVFNVASDRQTPLRPGQRGRAYLLPTPNTEVSARVIDVYVFEFSRTFQPQDRTALTDEDRQTISSLTAMLGQYFEQHVERRLLEMPTGSAIRPPQGTLYERPPLVPPAWRPLPLP